MLAIATSCLNACVLWLIATRYFGAPFKGNISFLALATLLFIICANGFGLVISFLVRTQQSAIIVATILASLLAMQFSGIPTPVSSMTGASRVVARIFPPLYYENVILGTLAVHLAHESLSAAYVEMIMYYGDPRIPQAPQTMHDRSRSSHKFRTVRGEREMSLVRWEPFAGMEETFNRLMPSLFGRRPRFLLNENGDAKFEWSPSADVSETETEYLIRAELPAVKKEDIKVSIDRGMLTIEGERKQKSEDKSEKYHRVESFHGTFSRSFSLPENVNADAIRCESKDGVLTVHVPKTPAEKPKAIKVE